MLVLLVGVMMSAVMAFILGLYLYQDGLKCLFEKDELKCAKDESCHWVRPKGADTGGKCVPRRYYQLAENEEIRPDTGCAIVGDETKCTEYEDEDCVWTDGVCKFHACYAYDDVGECNTDDQCTWNSDQLKCRKKV